MSEPVEITGLNVKALWYEEDPSARPGWSPNQVNPGESVNIYVEVINRTDTEQTYTLELEVTGKVFKTHTLKLVPKEKRIDKFTYPTDPAENWKYVVNAAGMRDSIIAGTPPIIVVVSDIGGRGDLAFNDMAFKGGKEAEEKFGYHMIELISTTEADYIPNLRVAATHPHSQLIVGVGFPLSESLVNVAKEFPNKNFVGIETCCRFIKPLPNLLDVMYEEHKGSALVGALGALLAAEYEKPHIGGVFGIEIPVLWNFEIGYKWGAKWALEEWLPANKPEKKIDYTKEFVLWNYTGVFNDPALGKSTAEAQLEHDLAVCLAAAGATGLGVFTAVEKYHTACDIPEGEPPFIIGVDANQDWIKPGLVISSEMKRVDYGVTCIAKLVREDKFRDTVENMGGVVTLGIGTEVLGASIEGISVSTLADLEEFIMMGAKLEVMLGKKVLPMSKEEIEERVKAMRKAQPSWIWDAVTELEQKIRTGEPIADLNGDGAKETVPIANTRTLVDHWREKLG